MLFILVENIRHPLVSVNWRLLKVSQSDIANIEYVIFFLLNIVALLKVGLHGQGWKPPVG